MGEGTGGMRVRGWWVRVALVGLVVAALVPADGMAFGAVGAQDQGDRPPLQLSQLEDGMEALGSKRVTRAVVQAAARGYTVAEITDAIIDRLLTPKGTVVAEGAKVAPGAEPVGVVKDNGAPGGRVSTTTLTKKVLSEYETLTGSGHESPRAAAYGATEVIIGAGLNGYTPEQIILDGLLTPGGGMTPVGGVEHQGEVVIVKDLNKFYAHPKKIPGFVAPQGTPLRNSPPFHDLAAELERKLIKLQNAAEAKNASNDAGSLPTHAVYTITFTLDTPGCYTPEGQSTTTILTLDNGVLSAEGLSIPVGSDGTFSHSAPEGDLTGQVTPTELNGTLSLSNSCTGTFSGPRTG